jgi:hypothetical protein
MKCCKENCDNEPSGYIEVDLESKYKGTLYYCKEHLGDFTNALEKYYLTDDLIGGKEYP